MINCLPVIENFISRKDEYNKGLRSGYLLAQSDNAGMYKYKKALSEGKSVPEARKISRQIGKATAKKKNDKGAA